MSIPNALCKIAAGGLAHGVLLLNSNGIDVVPTPTKLQLRAIGGVLDMYFFTGPTPMEVLSQLTSVVGRPLLPPYWSLGLMNSKCGACPDASPSHTAAVDVPTKQCLRSAVASMFRMAMLQAFSHNCS